jgi:geranylgeranyl pyrophosphate synthase/predicted secreted hydrolase
MSAAFADWPKPGPIDLTLHDPPHGSSSTEWWYVNTHFEAEDGRPFSLFAAFFRIRKPNQAPGAKPEYAYSVTWALTDPTERAYYPDSRVDKSAPKMGIERIKNGGGSKDPRLNRAMMEVLERGKVPRPDRVFEGDVFVADGRLELDYAGARFDKQSDGSYRLRVSNDRVRAAADITFTPKKAPVRHGDDGVVKGHGGEDMFYYFVPRCDVAGTLTVRGETVKIAKGSGWYDHEFGGPTKEQAERAKKEKPPNVAWNWIGTQLDDGSELSAYSLVRAETGEVLWQWAVLIDETGASRSFHGITLTPRKEWRSTRTFHDYPIAWTLTLPEAELVLEVTACVDDQELITVISKPAFWEGRVDAVGTLAGRPVKGLGYFERSGFEPIKDLDDYFGAVGEEVRKSVKAVLPLDPTYDEVRSIIASKERDHYMDGVSLQQIAGSLFAPIREITDRGGKSWRSYAALACCDVVNGDSRKFVQWLAMPELLHVGSLIVDDVQDHSTVRRGKPTCHVIYGEPIAINAGTAAYFLAQKLLISSEISDAKKLQIYDLYFESMRAGHAGQAMDLAGPGDLVPDVVATGDAHALEARILATHRLKTAAPAGSLARMGAIAGGGTDAQVEAVGAFFESLGLAFQIVDDVLNLRGFKGNLKSAGEDIANGTITLPVAKGLGRLGETDRAWLWKTMQSKPKDPAVVGAVIAKLEAHGAIEACAEQARTLVEDAWATAAPLLDDSISKVMLRAFGWYVLERHY